MKYLYILFALALFGFTTNTNRSSKKLISYCQRLNYVPLYGDSIYICKTEVTNQEYLEYVNWIYTNAPKQYGQVLPDTLVWQNAATSYEPYVQFYFRHPAYKNYPVVGLTHSQMIGFCTWKSQQICQSRQFKDAEFKEILIRLPKEAEWVRAARGTGADTAQWPVEDVLYNINVKRASDQAPFIAKNVKDAGLITKQVNSLRPNSIGLFHICGNVAEMTQEQIAKGASWNDVLSMATINFPSEPILGASAKVGFRSILVIRK
jgi:formylglycine-generating enzyme required for sulfatase activity